MRKTAAGPLVSDVAQFYKAVGLLVRQTREKAGLKQDTLASRVGLTRTSVTNIEKGRQKVLLHTFCELASVLGVTPIELLPVAPDVAEEPALEELLKGRSRKEREWIKSAVISARKEG